MKVGRKEPCVIILSLFPRYQKTNAGGSGLYDMMQVRLMALPWLTWMSGAPWMRTWGTARERKIERERRIKWKFLGINNSPTHSPLPCLALVRPSARLNDPYLTPFSTSLSLSLLPMFFLPRSLAPCGATRCRSRTRSPLSPLLNRKAFSFCSFFISGRVNFGQILSPFAPSLPIAQVEVLIRNAWVRVFICP